MPVLELSILFVSWEVTYFTESAFAGSTNKAFTSISQPLFEMKVR